MRAATSSTDFPSDLHLFVDACVAKARADAGLEAIEVVFPSVPRVPANARVPAITVPSKKRRGPPPLPASVPSGSAPPPRIAESRERRMEKVDEMAETLAEGHDTAPPPRRLRARYWPIFFCAFVAGLSGAAAFVESPVGQRPEVKRVVGEVRAGLRVGVAVVRAEVRELSAE